MAGREQRQDALKKANEVRLQQSMIKREVAEGTISLAEALEDPRAATMRIEVLMMSQYRWGEDRTRRALRKAGVPLRKPTGRLTERQREALRAQGDL